VDRRLDRRAAAAPAVEPQHVGGACRVGAAGHLVVDRGARGLAADGAAAGARSLAGLCVAGVAGGTDSRDREADAGHPAIGAMAGRRHADPAVDRLGSGRPGFARPDPVGSRSRRLVAPAQDSRCRDL
ncbi:MAG: hypothetical protein AVDCRST_MAG51-1078, partial [uncultured Ramlibacter sp.]